MRIGTHGADQRRALPADTDAGSERAGELHRIIHITPSATSDCRPAPAARGDQPTPGDEDEEDQDHLLLARGSIGEPAAAAAASASSQSKSGAASKSRVADHPHQHQEEDAAGIEPTSRWWRWSPSSFLLGLLVGLVVVGVLVQIRPPAEFELGQIPLRSHRQVDDAVRTRRTTTTTTSARGDALRIQPPAASKTPPPPGTKANPKQTSGKPKPAAPAAAADPTNTTDCRPTTTVVSMACSPHFEGKYRLGDMVSYKRMRDAGGGGGAYHYEHFPTSIASDYIRATDVDLDFPVLDEVIRNQTETMYSSLVLPTNRTLVVHLRIGDVIGAKAGAGDSLLHQSAHYSRPLTYYLDILYQLAQRDEADGADPTQRIDRVVLVGGYHKSHGKQTQSERYVAGVKSLFEGAGYPVRLRLDCNADEDVVYMTAASHFVHSGGGFSGLLAKVIRRRHHEVFEPMFAPPPPLSQPHPAAKPKTK